MTVKTEKGGKVYLNYVEQWLDTISASESEDFREFAEVTPSVIEIWVYAGIVGYPGTFTDLNSCLLYTSPSPRDKRQSRMPSSA